MAAILGGDPLSRFLNEAAARPFEWGKWDCLLWLAEWIERETGNDPAAGLRGTYATLAGAARIVRGAGNMTRLVEDRLRPFGAVRISKPQRGAIGVVSVAGAGGEHFGDQAGAILLEGSAAVISQEGLTIARLPLVAAWRV